MHCKWVIVEYNLEFSLFQGWLSKVKKKKKKKKLFHIFKKSPL